ncbi:MAG TPA: toxin-antitoxin system, toxin component, PIN family protein [Phycisphaerales bacterium]|nr:toxin-antitoxin system, toxin component, PIN family protein [Phycisphaerales bacterium]
MKVLLDTCVWGGARGSLTEAGHDVEWTGDWQRDPGDEQILAHALANSRVVITQDKDFAELAIVHGKPHSGIIRICGIRAEEQGPVAVSVLKKFEDELAKGAIVTVTTDRIRIRVSSERRD